MGYSLLSISPNITTRVQLHSRGITHGPKTAWAKDRPRGFLKWRPPKRTYGREGSRSAPNLQTFMLQREMVTKSSNFVDIIYGCPIACSVVMSLFCFILYSRVNMTRHGTTRWETQEFHDDDISPEIYVFPPSLADHIYPKHALLCCMLKLKPRYINVRLKPDDMTTWFQPNICLPWFQLEHKTQ